jgi:hypothetical protein
MNHTMPPPRETICIKQSLQSENYRRNSERSALSSFLNEMLNDTSSVEIQIDNARSRRRCRSSSPPYDQYLSSPKKDRASRRWELLASSDRNDVMVSAPLRRHISHEPADKEISGGKFVHPASHTNCTVLSIQSQTPSFPTASKEEGCWASPCNSSVSSTTSDLLAEALNLLSTSSGDNQNSNMVDRRPTVPAMILTAEDTSIAP